MGGGPDLRIERVDKIIERDGKLKGIEDFEAALETVIKQEEGTPIDLEKTYQEIGQGIEAFDRAIFDIDKVQGTNKYVLIFRGKKLGRVRGQRRVEKLLEEILPKTGIDGTTDSVETTRENNIEAIIDTFLNDMADEVITDQLTDLETVVADIEVDSTDHIDSPAGSPTSQPNLQISDGPKMKDPERVRVEQLIRDGQEYVVIDRHAYKVINLGDDKYELVEFTKLPKSKKYEKDYQKLISDAKGKFQEIWGLIPGLDLATTIAILRSNLTKQRKVDKICAYQTRRQRRQRKKIAGAVDELLDVMNDIAEQDGELIADYQIPGDKTQLLQVIKQQDKVEGTILAVWLGKIDFDGSVFKRLSGEYEGGVTPTEARGERTGRGGAAQTAPSIAKYLHAQELDLESPEMKTVATAELVRKYKENPDSPEGTALGAELAKRVFSRPVEVREMLKQLTREEVHSLILNAYKSQDLMSDMRHMHHDTRRKEYRAQHPAFWKQHTDNFTNGSLACSYFNAFCRVHEIPFGNVRAVYSELYPDYDKLAPLLKVGMEVKASNFEETLMNEGLDDAFGNLLATGKMTPGQIEGWKTGGKLAVVGALLYFVVWKGLIMNENGRKGRLGVVAGLLAAQGISQYTTGEGILSLGNRLLTGADGGLAALGLGGGDAEVTDEMLETAKAYQAFEEQIGGTLAVTWIFADMTKSQAANYITTGPDGSYKITRKQQLQEKLTAAENTLGAGLLNHDDEVINRRLNNGLAYIGYEEMANNAKISDQADAQVEAAAEAALLQTELAEKEKRYREQLAPYAEHMDEVWNTYRDAETTTAERVQLEDRIQTLIELKPLLTEEMLVHIPGLTADQQAEIRINLTDLMVGGQLEAYVTGDYADQQSLAKGIAEKLSDDSVAQQKVLEFLTGKIPLEQVIIPALQEVADQVQEEIEGRGGVVQEVRTQRGDMEVIKSTVDGEIYLKSYNERVARLDTEKLQVSAQGVEFPLQFESVEAMIRFANFTNAVLEKFSPTVNPNLLKDLRDENAPFTLTDNPFSRWVGNAGIEVDVNDPNNWNYGLYDVGVVSKDGLKFISDRFAGNNENTRLVVAFFNELYQKDKFI